MAMPIVIAKNQTGSDIDLNRLGLRVPASGQLTLTDYSTYTECTEDEDLETQTAAGNIVINDGTIDLSTAEALVYLDSSGNLNGPPTGAAANLLIKLLDTSGERTVVTGVTVDGSDNIVTPGSVTASNFFLTGAVPFGLQEAYDNGNGIITAGATDILFTLTSGGLTVQGGGNAAFGDTTPLGSFVVTTGTSAAEIQFAGGVDTEILTLTQTTGESFGFYAGTADPSGSVTADAASWFFRDTGTGAEAYQNISTGSGTDWARNVNEVNHKALRDLIHFIDDGPADGFATGSYKEIQYNGALITQEIWWEDNTKTQKIVQLDVTYTGAFPTTEVWQMFDTDGVSVLVTLTDSITYTGALETTRTRAWV